MFCPKTCLCSQDEKFKQIGTNIAVYVVFTPEHLRYPDTVVESRATIRKVDIITYLIPYDEVKDFEG